MITTEKYGMSNKDQPKTQDSLIYTLKKQTKEKCTGKLIVGSKTATIPDNICVPMRLTFYGGYKYFLILAIAEQ